MNTELETVSAARGWAFPLLTLDRVRPFYELMGVPNPADASPDLMQVLRTATLDIRRQRPNGFADLGSNGAAYAQAVAQWLGPETASRVGWWLQHVLYDDTQSRAGLFRWIDLLRHCRREAGLWSRLDLPTDVAGTALSRFDAAIDMSECKRIEQATEQHDLSDWDLHMHASQLYDDDDSTAGVTVRPAITLRLTVRTWQRLGFWAWAVRALDAEQLDRLWHNARCIADEDDLGSMSKVPHPTTLLPAR